MGTAEFRAPLCLRVDIKRACRFKTTQGNFSFEAIWGNFFLFYKGFYIRHQIVMRNVAALFITGERLRAEIFIDTVRTFKGLKSSEESEDRLHLQEEDSSSPKE